MGAYSVPVQCGQYWGMGAYSVTVCTYSWGMGAHSALGACVL